MDAAAKARAEVVLLGQMNEQLAAQNAALQEQLAEFSRGNIDHMLAMRQVRVGQAAGVGAAAAGRRGAAALGGARAASSLLVALTSWTPCTPAGHAQVQSTSSSLAGEVAMLGAANSQMGMKLAGAELKLKHQQARAGLLPCSGRPTA